MPTQREPSGACARPAMPGCPTLDFSASIEYVSEAPSCQWTRAVCPPSQNPPFPSPNKELIGEIGIPSAFPKHVTAVLVIWHSGRSEILSLPRTTQIDPSV